MFVAQLAHFLMAHHHAHWAQILTTCSAQTFDRIEHWAIAHGFKYQP